MNHKLKTISLTLLTLLLGVSALYAQEQTSYQKKLVEIKKVFIKEIFIAKDKWTDKMAYSLDTLSEKELNKLFPSIKLALAGISEKEDALKIINNFTSSVSEDKNIKIKKLN
ncbi:MAG: hypothetical protein QM751_05920 [Paludibacteraceae bacterium]